jgi:hypothetical protein
MHVLTTSVEEANTIERRVRGQYPDAKILRVDTADLVIVNSAGSVAGKETGATVVVGPIDLILTTEQLAAIAQSEEDLKREQDELRKRAGAERAEERQRTEPKRETAKEGKR